MSQEVYRDLIKRHGAKKADRTTVEVMWEAIERFVTPYRGRFFYDQRSEHSIDWFNSRDIYDSTPVMAHRNLSASIHGSLTSPTLRWFDLRFRNEELNGDKGSVGWLQDAADAVHYELQDSNWDLEINKAYQDVCGFGTTALVLEEGPGRADWGGLEFISVPLKEVYFELGYDGQAVRFFREIEWTPQQIMTKFGDDVPGKVKELEKAGSDAKLKVLYCIYPRNNKIMKWGEKVAPSRRPWASCYLLLECDDDDRKLGVVKDVIRARAKQIDPPILAEERSIITDLNLDPATISVVRSVKGVVPFLTGGQVMTADAEIDRLQANIRSYFMVDRIDFPDMQPQPMTATEAQIRYERMQRYMGATLAQLRVELLNPVVERTFNMMVRKGLIPKPPEKVTKAGGIYEVEYLGSLTRAQQVDEVTAIERTMMTAGSLAEVFPDALDVIDAPKAIRMIGRKLNAPATIMRDEKEVKAKQKEREDKREAMEANALMQAEGEAMQAQGEGQNAMGGEVEGAQSPA
jgi:hypothetical protein